MGVAWDRVDLRSFRRLGWWCLFRRLDEGVHIVFYIIEALSIGRDRHSEEIAIERASIM